MLAFWTVDTGDVPPDDPMNPDPYPLPGGLGLFISAGRSPVDQSPIVLYYDRSNGNLKEAKFDVPSGQFGMPTVLAGTTDDAGWSPTVAVDSNGVVNAAYVDATKDDLDFTTDGSGATVETVDDGYRIVGMSPDGYPEPEFDFVGDDATLVLVGNGSGTVPLIAYQDATTQELLLAHKQQDGTWTHESIAGATMPWPGGYGFFASAANSVATGELVMSSWVIDQPTGDNWVEVFRVSTGALQ